MREPERPKKKDKDGRVANWNLWGKQGYVRYIATVGCVLLPALPRDTEKKEWERAIANVEDEGWISFYTEGSRVGGKTGAGLFYNGMGTSIYLGTQSTVNDAKLIAMGKALAQ
ncbi:hypothetical protein BDZ91DRAFT_799430 [Kalaharituber pfeilii]|nr:hypothetical protein BDZ91DRAFT_799430 [Kalaharituber pfeilii]